MRMISTVIPYCDAAFIDRECHTLLSEQPVSVRVGYGIRFFSHRNKEEFVTYLEGIETSATPEHLALLDTVYGTF